MVETYLKMPFGFAAEGATLTTDEHAVIRQRLEQILFTSPGERVMLPEFGCGLRDLIFAGNTEVLAAAAEFTVAKALQAHMGTQVMINAVDVVNEGERLLVHILYTRTRDLQQEKVVFQLLPVEGGRRG